MEQKKRNLNDNYSQEPKKNNDLKFEIIFLTPAFVPKIWGSQRLRTLFGFDIPNDEKIGEAWLISALPQAMSYVKNGKFKGLSLQELYQNHPEIFGYPDSPSYPLLSKILDANDNLSVQFHPDDKYAQQHHQSLGKTECWYVLDCPTDHQVIYGHQAQTNQQLLAWIKADKFDQLLKKIPIKQNQFIYVPALKVHGLLANTLVFELQQSADITYRLYDYDRLDLTGKLRPLNLKEASELLVAPDKDSSSANTHDNYLVDNQFFKLIKIDNQGQKDYVFQKPKWLQVSVIKGNGTINDIKLKVGDSFILPNGCHQFRLIGDLMMMISYI